MFTRSKEDGLKDFRKLNNALEQASKASAAGSGDISTVEAVENSNSSTNKAVKSILKPPSAATMAGPSSPSSQVAGKSKKRKRVSWTKDTDFRDDPRQSKKARQRTEPEKNEDDEANKAALLTVISSSDPQSEDDPRACKAIFPKGDFVVERVYNLRNTRRAPDSPNSIPGSPARKKQAAATRTADNELIDTPSKQIIKPVKVPGRKVGRPRKQAPSTPATQGSAAPFSAPLDAEEAAMHEQLASELFPELSSTPPVSSLSSLVQDEKSMKKPLFRPASKDSTAASDDFYFFGETADITETDDLTGGPVQNDTNSLDGQAIEMCTATSTMVDVSEQNDPAGRSAPLGVCDQSGKATDDADTVPQDLSNSPDDVPNNVPALPAAQSLAGRESYISKAVPAKVHEPTIKSNQDKFEKDSARPLHKSVDSDETANHAQTQSDLVCTAPITAGQVKRGMSSTKSRRKVPSHSDRKTRSSTQQITFPALPPSHLLASIPKPQKSPKKQYQRYFYPSKPPSGEKALSETAGTGTSGQLDSAAEIEDTTLPKPYKEEAAAAGMRLLFEAALFVEGGDILEPASVSERGSIPSLSEAADGTASRADIPSAISPLTITEHTEDISLANRSLEELGVADILLCFASQAVDFEDEEPEAQHPQLNSLAAASTLSLEPTCQGEAFALINGDMEVSADDPAHVGNIEGLETLAGIPRTPSPPILSKAAVTTALSAPMDTPLSHPEVIPEPSIHSDYSPVCPSCVLSPVKSNLNLDGSCIHSGTEEAPAAEECHKQQASEVVPIATSDIDGTENEAYHAYFDYPQLNERSVPCGSDMQHISQEHKEPELSTHRSAYSPSAFSSANTAQTAVMENYSPYGSSRFAAYAPNKSVMDRIGHYEEHEEDFTLPPPLQPQGMHQKRVRERPTPHYQSLDPTEVHGFGRLTEDGFSHRTLNRACESPNTGSKRDLSKKEIQQMRERKSGESRYSGVVSSAAAVYAHSAPIPEETRAYGEAKENIYPVMRSLYNAVDVNHRIPRLPGNPNGWPRQPDRRSLSLPSPSNKVGSLQSGCRVKRSTSQMAPRGPKKSAMDLISSYAGRRRR